MQQDILKHKFHNTIGLHHAIVNRVFYLKIEQYKIDDLILK